jgi:hypothetical protein
VSNTPTIANSQGTPQPNPSYFGFKRGAWGENDYLRSRRRRGSARPPLVSHLRRTTPRGGVSYGAL